MAFVSFYKTSAKVRNSILNNELWFVIFFNIFYTKSVIFVFLYRFILPKRIQQPYKFYLKYEENIFSFSFKFLL